MSAPFDEAIQIRHGYEPVAEEFCATSTLLPVLATWTAVLDMRDGYDFLRDKVWPRLGGGDAQFLEFRSRL
jgi:hypothetical protein